MQTWFLLYDGSSVDGTGPGRYAGRTTDWRIARDHYLSVVSSPYNVGRVDVVTDETVQRAGPWCSWWPNWDKA